ncbi:MAG TPA: oligopeptide/dipeptide ABC transporter ATP-binding protein [Gaiellaceae bacterium]|nr:oligopeptide/dipeptide ABC transporter ATP-binding protein [Gaiellaceae bacterium]
MDAAEPLLQVENMEVSYPQPRGARFVAAREVGFSVRAGEVFGLVGESGSGKSSVAKGLMHLAQVSGEVRFDGIEWLAQRGAALRRLRPRMQMVFQDPFSSLDPRMSVHAITSEPLDIHEVGTRAERRERATEMLELVGLTPAHAKRKPSALSGGQRQRVAIARALALNPKLVVLDEPVSALDVSIQAQVLNLLSDLRARLGLTYIFIVHDLVVAEYFCDNLAVMFGGRIMEMGSSRSIFRAPAHPYTLELLAAVPIPDPSQARKRTSLPAATDPAAESAADTGCPYQHRCLLRQGRSICGEETPALRRRGDGQFVACHFSDELTGRETSVPAVRS